MAEKDGLNPLADAKPHAGLADYTSAASRFNLDRRSEPAKKANGKTQTKLSSLIWNYRNARVANVGYDDPTYFGFMLDIHSRDPECTHIENPYTGLRANPLFYFSTEVGAPDANGKVTSINDGKSDGAQYVSKLLGDLNEASALLYINNFDQNLDKIQDETLPGTVTLNKAAYDSYKTDDPNKKTDKTQFNRAYYLTKFKTLLNNIQERSPWTFKELEGINHLWSSSYGKTGGATDSNPEIELTVLCDESVDLRVTKMAHYYKMLSYDSFNKRKIIPHNLEQFSMDVYFMDLRNIDNLTAVGESGDINPDFINQVNFGGVAFRCFGCTFDFSGMFDQSATGIKSSVESTELQPKFKIKIKRVLPATYFGPDSFGETYKEDLTIPNIDGEGLSGAFDLGPFTGGITRVINQVTTMATNFINKPIVALNDAVAAVQRKFEANVNSALSKNGAETNPYGKVAAETLLNSRKTTPLTTDLFPGVDIRTTNPIVTDVFPGQDIRTTSPIINDVFPGQDIRTTNPIVNDVFPGVDIRTANPIVRDEFPGQDVRTTNPITTDIFPGQDSRVGSPISVDVFPGQDSRVGGPISADVFPGVSSGEASPIVNNYLGSTSVESLVNQRRSGGKISSQNLFKQ